MHGDMSGKLCVVTGGTGVLGTAIVHGLAMAGVRTAIVGTNKVRAEAAAALVARETGTASIGVEANVLDKAALERACTEVEQRLGAVDFLINGAGGNAPTATTKVEFVDDTSTPEATFLGLELEGFRKVFDLNFTGTLLPTMVFAKGMIARKSGVVLNISSMNSFRPLTKIPAYSAAKASINNFTQWLSVHLAKVNVRVNAVAPGFFLTAQNRFLLTDEKTGELTARGRKILTATPMGRFGEPEELVGTVLYLLSDASRFVTGVVVPVDGGFSAYSGV